LTIQIDAENVQKVQKTLQKAGFFCAKLHFLTNLVKFTQKIL